MDIFLVILSVICLLTGLAGCFLPVIPGPALSYICLFLLHLTPYAQFGTTTLVVWGIITLLICVMDYILPSWMTRKFGDSKYAGYGALAGMFAGLPFGITGIILGPFLGALVGELLYDRTNPGKAAKAAFGSFLAFFVGTGIKVAVSFIFIGMAIIAVF